MNKADGISVIVAEDEPKLLRSIIRKIEESGLPFHVVDSASGGEEALKRVIEKKPDLLITDIVMPRMDGIELIGTLREKGSNLPVIVISGYDNFEYAQQAIKFGVKDYLLKPLDDKEFRQTLSDLHKKIVESRKKEELDFFSTVIEFNEVPDLEIANSRNLKSCYIFLIGIGNQFSHEEVPDVELLEYYSTVWNLLPVDHWLEEQLSEKVWLMPEPKVNRKLVICSESGKKFRDIQNAAELLQNRINEVVFPLKANIVFTSKPNSPAELHSAVTVLRTLLINSQVLNETFILPDNEKSRAHYMGLPSEPLPETRLFSLLQAGDIDTVYKEVIAFIRSSEENSIPFIELSSYFRNMVNLIRRSSPFISATELNEFNEKLIHLLYSAINYGELEHHFPALMNSLFSVQEKLTSERIADLLEEYINTHYMEQISLESASRRLGFNSSYLTQLFKRHKADTPGKYMIRCRMEKAEILLTSRPELKIREIGEMVGYQDKNYFHRVFKKYFGKTPDEFRKSY